MKKRRDDFLRFLTEYHVGKEVACIRQVEEVIKRSGIKITDSFGIFLKLLQSEEINMVLYGKLTEAVAIFQTEIDKL